MNKKQLTVAWGKKILAFILDIFFAIVFVLIIELTFIFILALFGVDIKKYINFIVENIIFFSYFIIATILFGNTFGRKILKIKDKFNIFWSPLNRLDRKYDRFPAKHLKKEEILKVLVKDDYWICPSCNDKNKELQDVCSNCGQEIEKNG